MTHPKLRATILVADGALAALTVTNAIIRASLATLRSRRSIPWFSRPLACVAVGACLLAGLVASARPAHAAFPGANGKIAFTSGRSGSFDIYVMNADGGEQTRLTTNTAPDLYPAWSPDGTKIAFESYPDGGGDIYVVNADGSGQTRLTTNTGHDLQPAWSPDGMRLAFMGERGGNYEIYVMNADGSAEAQLTSNPYFDSAPAWSPDGTKIAFTSWRDGNYDIYVMDADGSAETRMTNDPAADVTPAWSPDASKLAFVSWRDGNGAIHVMNADGTNLTRLATRPVGGFGVSWSPDGAKIVFESFGDSGADADIYVVNADGSGQTRLTNHPEDDFAPDWQPIVADTTPPTLTIPGPLSVDATSPAGAIVNFTVSVTDDVDPSPSVGCAPPSGSAFAVGETTVTCTATDATGNSAGAVFTIHVRSATEQLLELQTLIEGYQLKRGLGSDLSRYLNRAVKYIGSGQTGHACQQLDQFLATVERTASKTPPSLSSSQATTLREGGRRIRAVVGC